VGTNIEAEMRDLKRRVREIERSFAGPALHLSELHRDLLAFQARMEQRFDRVLGRHGRVSGRFDKIDSNLIGSSAGCAGYAPTCPKTSAALYARRFGTKREKSNEQQASPG
jgi:hypothetical protein